MKFITEILKESLQEASKKAGYIGDLNVQVCTLENMGDYQCNDAMGMAKIYHKAPFIIAQEIVDNFSCPACSTIEVAKPGYINITLDNDFLSTYVSQFIHNIDTDIKTKITPMKTIVDYGGANVAKPLHVGHLRSLTIGESIKRICKYLGNETLGDIHLGDWGLQMGMIIAELHRLHPDWNYFDKDFKGEYSKESPLTIKDLENIYPEASKHAKEDDNLMEEARLATLELQKGRKGYRALWRHFVDISIADMKKSYEMLNVNFELWLGESDSHPYCQQVIDLITKKGFAQKSQGAIIVDISKEDDKKELPPFMLVKSDGAILYSTTEVATILQREKEFNVDKIIYLADNRQELHFTQVFRCIEKTGILSKDIDLHFVGFGTMNGKDGKPYKTREGGVMQLKKLIQEIKDKATLKAKESENEIFSQEETENISNTVAVSALKFADLSIFRTKDYIFDIDKFASFDGKTGPYILYTITRAKSILRKIGKYEEKLNINLCDRKIALALIQFADEVLTSYNQLAPSVLCDYVYKIANMFNSFYANTNIIKEQNKEKQNSLLTLTSYTLNIMEKVLNLLGIKSLDRM